LFIKYFNFLEIDNTSNININYSSENNEKKNVKSKPLLKELASSVNNSNSIVGTYSKTPSNKFNNKKATPTAKNFISSNNSLNTHKNTNIVFSFKNFDDIIKNNANNNPINLSSSYEKLPNFMVNSGKKQDPEIPSEDLKGKLLIFTNLWYLIIFKTIIIN